VKDSRSKLLIATLAGVSLSVWLFVIGSGEKDPTDNGYWYLGLFIPTIIAGFLAPERPWRWATAMILPQVLAPFYPEASNIWPLSLKFLGLLFLILLLAARASAWLRKTAQRLITKHSIENKLPRWDRQLSILSDLEYLLPDFLVSGKFLIVFIVDGVDFFRPGLIHGFHFRVSRCSTARREDSLSLFAGRPTMKEPRGVGMRRPFENRGGADRRDAFRKHIIHRRSLLDPGREMMRVTSQTHCALSRDQQLGELGMAPMKFEIVGGNLP
jgi:hypothetical protein